MKTYNFADSDSGMNQGQGEGNKGGMSGQEDNM